MKKNIEYVFTSCYTARGYISFLQQLLSKLDRVILLDGCPGSGKSTFMRKAGLNFRERGYETQFWLSPRDPAYLDGIFIPQLRIAIIDHDLLNGSEKFADGVEIQCLDLGSYLRENQGYFVEVENLQNASKKLCQQVTETLNLAGKARQELVHGPGMSRLDLAEISSFLIQDILKQPPKADHFFASAITSQGIVDYYEEISSNCQHRYLLRDAEPADISLVLQEIADEALAHGFSIDYYHSKLNPDEVEMIIIKERRTAIVNAAVLRAANKPGDIVIEMTPGQDLEADRAEAEFDEAERRFNQLLFDAIQKLDQMCEAEQKLSRLVTKAMAFEQLDVYCEELVQEILTMK